MAPFVTRCFLFLFVALAIPAPLIAIAGDLQRQPKGFGNSRGIARSGHHLGCINDSAPSCNHYAGVPEHK